MVRQVKKPREKPSALSLSDDKQQSPDGQPICMLKRAQPREDSPCVSKQQSRQHAAGKAGQSYLNKQGSFLSRWTKFPGSFQTKRRKTVFRKPFTRTH